jgi:hypothetical protein
LGGHYVESLEIGASPGAELVARVTMLGDAALAKEVGGRQEAQHGADNLSLLHSRVAEVEASLSAGGQGGSG